MLTVYVHPLEFVIWELCSAVSIGLSVVTLIWLWRHTKKESEHD